jgi:serine/threonine protein kinase
VPADVAARDAPGILGRYAIYGEIGSGGMATVYFGRLRGARGFSRPVAIKRLHPQFAKTPRFVDAFLDEARLAAQVRHPNVVPTLDVVAEEGELLLVMEYVPGASLAELWDLAVARHDRVPPKIAAAIVAGALRGLHAAHEAKDEGGEPLGIVHRDVSPHNILVGTDGVARVLDFGVAKAELRVRTTSPGEVKGKLAYMAPEQIMLEQTSGRSDVYSASVVLWEALTGELLFRAENHGSLISKVLSDVVKAPSSVAREVSPELDAIVLRALSRNAEERPATALAFAVELEDLGVASPKEVAEWVSHTAGEEMASRALRAADVEQPSVRFLEPLAASGDNTDATGEHSASAEVVEAPPPIVEVTAKQSSRRTLWPLGIALVAVSVLSLAAWRTIGTREPATSTSTVAPTPAPAPTATATATATAAATTTSTAAATSTASRPTSLVQRPLRAPSPPSSAAPAPSCSPPFTIDADGIKRLKRECL